MARSICLHFGEYRLSLKPTGERERYGKAIISYTFRKVGEPAPIFKGEDYSPAPSIYRYGNDWNTKAARKCANDLLVFLTLQEGDTDSEYFENYTPRQLAWRDNEAEQFSWDYPEIGEDE
jgi:hypothetical protein